MSRSYRGTKMPRVKMRFGLMEEKTCEGEAGNFKQMDIFGELVGFRTQHYFVLGLKK